MDSKEWESECERQKLRREGFAARCENEGWSYSSAQSLARHQYPEVDLGVAIHDAYYYAETKRPEGSRAFENVARALLAETQRATEAEASQQMWMGEARKAEAKADALAEENARLTAALDGWDKEVARLRVEQEALLTRFDAIGMSRKDALGWVTIPAKDWLRAIGITTAPTTEPKP